MKGRRAALAVVVAGLLGACADAGPAAPPATSAAPPSRVPAATTAVPSTSAATSVVTTVVTSPVPSSAPTTAAPVFQATVAGLTPEVRATMTGRSWRPGCPVGLDELRLLELSHWDLEGVVRTGRLVVHEDHAADLVTVFGRLFEARFPIERMEPVDGFDGDDDASMAANNTSAFNCRMVSGSSSWSEHAYGRAVDLNPRFNPWVTAGRVDPPAGAAYVDRSLGLPGMIVAGDVVVRAFAAIGWTWGGTFARAKDYQHFSATGR